MPKNRQTAGPRPFEFARDTFAFENETYWEYHFDAAGNTTFSPRAQKPTYGHRCFVMARGARQFFFHVRFEPGQKPPDDDTCRDLIRQVVARDPRRPCPPEKQIVVSGYANLRDFSKARESLLKAECGGAWRSYVLPSHWRMVFPISPAHQAATASSLMDSLRQNVPPLIHLVNFPSLSINHGMALFAAEETAGGIAFQVYDPNVPAVPHTLSFDHESKRFSLPRNHYWAGGTLNIIEIYRT